MRCLIKIFVCNLLIALLIMGIVGPAQATFARIVNTNAKQVQVTTTNCDYNRMFTLADEIVRNAEPDIIAFQEIPVNQRNGTDVYDFVSNLNYHARNRGNGSNYQYVAGDWEVNSERGGVGLIANVSFVENRVATLLSQMGFSTKEINPATKSRRVAVFGLFRKQGINFITASTHYGTNKAWQVPYTSDWYSAWTASEQNQASTIVNNAMGDIYRGVPLPKMLAGDLNFHVMNGSNWSSQYNYLRFQANWWDSGEIYPWFYTPTFNSTLSGLVRIDYIWGNRWGSAGQAPPIRSGVLRNRDVGSCGLASDHTPIWADFDI